MSEEKPTFKVTDRRLFNADGTPREDIPREEEVPPPQAAAPDTAPTAEAETARAPAEEGGAARVPEVGGESQSDAEASQEFLMLVEFVASFAADALGMVNHPGAPPGEVNLPLAKQCIDMLGALQRKTRGNLAAQEGQFLEMILSQLRMQYVSLSGAPQRAPKGARGFTGGDITGGR